MQFSKRVLEEARARWLEEEALKQQLAEVANDKILQAAADKINEKKCFDAYSEAYAREGKFPDARWMKECQSSKLDVRFQNKAVPSRPHYEIYCRYVEDDFYKLCNVVLLPSKFQ